MYFSTQGKRSFAALVFLCGVTSACASSSSAEVSSVSPHVEILGKMSSALDAASVTSIAGTYGALCSVATQGGGDHNAADTWVYNVSGGGTNLEVVRNDLDCVLTIRAFDAGGVTYTGNPAIPLDSTSYQSGASRFELAGGALGFYGNAKIDSLSFAADFNVTMLLSADPAATYR